MLEAFKPTKLPLNHSPHLVLLQVPAFDHLVEATGEHVRVPRTHSKAGDLPRSEMGAWEWA